MTDNVVKLKKRADMYREDMKEMVEELLAMIEDGKVAGVACIAVFKDDMVSVSAAQSDRQHHLVAGTIYLQRELVGGFD